MVMESCNRCKFFTPMGREQGKCRRYPPTVVTFGASFASPDSRWPDVKAHDGCGEFKQNPNQDRTR